MLVRCKSCSKPVFISSSAVSSGPTQITCKACKTELVVDGDGDVTLAGGESVPASPVAATPPAPAPEAPEAPEAPNSPGASISPGTSPTAAVADAGAETPTPAVPPAETPGPPFDAAAGDAEERTVVAPSPLADPAVSSSPVPEPAPTQVAPSPFPEPAPAPAAPPDEMLTGATESGEGAPFAPSTSFPAPQGPVIEHNPTAEPTQIVENPTATGVAEVTAGDTPVVDIPEVATHVAEAPVPQDNQAIAGLAPEPSVATLPPRAAVFSPAETQIAGPPPASSPAFDATAASPAVGLPQAETPISGLPAAGMPGLHDSALPSPMPAQAPPWEAENQIGMAPESPALPFGAAGVQPPAGNAETTVPASVPPSATDTGRKNTLISKDEPLDGLEVSLTPGGEEPFEAPRQPMEVLANLDMPPPMASRATELIGAPVAAFDEADSVQEVASTDTETGNQSGNLLGASAAPVDEDEDRDEDGDGDGDEELFVDVFTPPTRRVYVVGLVVVLFATAAAGGLWAFGIIEIPGAPPGPLAGLTEQIFGQEPQGAAAEDAEELPGEELALAAPDLRPLEVPAADPKVNDDPDHKPNGKGSRNTQAALQEPTEHAAEPAALTHDEVEERPKKRKRRKKKASKTVKKPKSPKSAKPTTTTKKLSADDHYRRADSLMRQKKVPAAIDELQMAVAANPRHSKAYRLLGMAFWSIGKQKSAVTAFERFIKLDPRHKDVPKLRALIAKQKK